MEGPVKSIVFMRQNLAEAKLDIIKHELDRVQSSIDKYDETNFKIRGWEVTIWSALMVVYFQSGKHTVLAVALLMPFVFFVLDGMYKSFREGYKSRRNDIIEYLSSEKFEREYGSGKISFRSPRIPYYTYSSIAKECVRPHVFPMHLMLFLMSLALYFYLP